jgi:hypothetical protein
MAGVGLRFRLVKGIAGWVVVGCEPVMVGLSVLVGRATTAIGDGRAPGSAP